MKKIPLFSVLLLLSALVIMAFQQLNPGKIKLYNPSFEDTPRASASPAGWRSMTPGSTPDIMPGAWGVNCPPQEGRSCLALVTREDGSSEDVSQVLVQPMRKDSCYSFTLFLSHSDSYVGYNMPVRLRIWGGSGLGRKEVLLASSPLIDGTEWNRYKFQFVPTRSIKAITFEAYYAPGAMFHYRGNILLDNCSEIERCNRA